ncbi:MAG: RDD family protein [Terracidiphilus sp.]
MPNANLFPSWKEEVSRRVADHKNRKNAGAHELQTRAEVHSIPNGRAARAAARVAARYANAPSYNQMLADEAHAAIRAAEAAQMAADDAHAAAQMVLAGLEAATSAEPVLELQSPTVRKPNRQRTRPVRTRPETTSPGGEMSAAELTAPAATTEIDPFAEMRLQPLEPTHPDANADRFGQPDFPAQPQPIPANLIQFPREMVAARRLRPRRVEGPLAEIDSAPQLSIFEVDPGAVSTEPIVPVENEPTAPVWMRPERPAAVLEWETEGEVSAEAELLVSPRAPVVDLAPVNRRLLAIVIDGSLTLAAFAGLVRLAAPAARFLHSPRAAEVCALLAVALACAGYQMLFASLTKTTPGMWYAGIGLCTLDGYVPERQQRCARLLALLLSVAPLGLGLAWSLFDEDRLTWHDRLSSTYLRMR